MDSIMWLILGSQDSRSTSCFSTLGAHSFLTNYLRCLRSMIVVIGYRASNMDLKVEGPWNTEKYCCSPVGRQGKLNSRRPRMAKTVTF